MTPEGLSSTLWRKLREHTGLSEYEAKVYVSLVLNGPSKARDISKICGIPRTKVYETLEKLFDQSLITRVSGTPLRFSSEPPDNSFEAYLNSFEEKARDFEWVISILKNSYKKMKDAVKIDKAEVWIFRGRREVLEKVREMMSRAEKHASIISSSAIFVLVYKIFNKTIDEMLKKGVKIQFYTSIDSYSKNVAMELRHICEVRHVAVKSPILLVFIDGKEFLLAKFAQQALMMEEKELGEDLGMFSADLNLYNLLSEIFQVLFPLNNQTFEMKNSVPQ